MHQSAAVAAVRFHVVPAVLALLTSRDSASLSPRRVTALVGASTERRSPVSGAVELLLHGSLRSNSPRRANASPQGSQNSAVRRKEMTAVIVGGLWHPPFMHIVSIPSCGIADNTPVGMVRQYPKRGGTLRARDAVQRYCQKDDNVVVLTKPRVVRTVTTLPLYRKGALGPIWRTERAESDFDATSASTWRGGISTRSWSWRGDPT